jgi:hypothetical protein
LTTIPTTVPKTPNFWKTAVPYPDVHRRSILERLPLGVLPTAGHAETGAVFREHNAYVWGVHGSGRTMTLRNITAGAVQCTNSLVWTIGASLALPLLRPFGAGRVGTPCIDWVAPTLDEAYAMARTALSIALHRNRVYTELKYQHNTNLMPVGGGSAGSPPPAILIVVGHDAPSMVDRENKHLYDLLRMLDDHGRDSAVRVVYSGLRAAADHMPQPAPAIRIGMRTIDPFSMQCGFGDPDLEPIPHIGGGYLRADDFADTEAFKAFYLDPVRLDQIGEQTAVWRPVLDKPSWSVDAETYAFRWGRTAGELWDQPAATVPGYQGCS